MILVVGLVLASSPGRASEPRSSLEVGVANGLPGARVEVPVRVADMHGTPLGDEMAGDRAVRGIAFRVVWRPEGALTCDTVRRAGSTQLLDPVFEASPAASGSVAWLASFPAGGAELVRSEPGLAAPNGQMVAMIGCTVSADARPGTTVTLRLDPRVSVLSNAGGTVEESVRNGTLRLGNGRITVVGPGTSDERP